MDFFVYLVMENLNKDIKKQLSKKRFYEVLFLLLSIIFLIFSTIYVDFDMFFIIMAVYYAINYFIKASDYNFISFEVDEQFVRINYFNWFGDLKQAVFPSTAKIVVVKDKQFFKKRHFLRVDKEDGFQVFDIFDEESIKTIPEQFLKD